jgi:hypothetical protein
MRELADVVLGTREDRKLVRPVLLQMLQTAVNDFTRYYDSRQASNRVRDYDMLVARNKAAKAKPAR